jgi:hypothetical protein
MILLIFIFVFSLHVVVLKAQMITSTLIILDFGLLRYVLYRWVSRFHNDSKGAVVVMIVW